MKINVDASLYKHSGHAAVGMMGCNANRHLLLAISICFIYAGDDVLNLETLALFYGVQVIN